MYKANLFGFLFRSEIHLEAGIPSMDVKFVNGEYNQSSSLELLYPAKGTGYDTIEFFEKKLFKPFSRNTNRLKIEPEYQMLETCSQLVTVLIRELGDSLLLPFDVKQYYVTLNEAWEHLKEYKKKEFKHKQSSGKYIN